MPTIKIRPPDRLPPTEVSMSQFKTWKTSLEIYLKQEANYRRFLPGGDYQTWKAAEDGTCLDALASDNADRNGNIGERNVELETFLGQIGACCQHTEFDDIMTRSTSFNWVIHYLEQHYNLEKRGAHFRKLTDIIFDKSNNESHQTFYKRYRSHITDNLRKQGETLKHK